MIRYRLTFSPTANQIIINASCEDQICEGRTGDISASLCDGSQSTDFNVTVTAENVLGPGPPSQPFYIGKINYSHYRRRWLLSACAYKNEQQGNMRLIKNMRLTASVRLIERA